MKYSIRYYKGCTALDKASEIIIKYMKKDAAVLDFVQKHISQRVILDVTSAPIDLEDNLELFTAASKLNEDFALLLSFEKQSPICDRLKELGVNFFFIEYADTLDRLSTFITYGVSDVYIANELGFNLLEVSKLCKKNNISIRVFPNVAQSSMSSAARVNTFKFFFIRPEDVKTYESFVDIFEFFCPLEKQAVLYRIYENGKWIDSLNYIILGLDLDINSNMIAPGFAERRINCQKKCTFGLCHTCDRIASLGEAMRENGYQFREEKVDNENTIIQGLMQDVPNSTTWYTERVSKGEISESYS